MSDMSSRHCQFCDRVFSSCFNRKRHEQRFHGEEEEQSSDTEMDEPSKVKKTIFDSDSENDEENDNEEEDSEEDEDDEESEKENDLGEKEEQLWERLIRETCQEAEDIPATSLDEVLQVPSFPIFMSLLREKVEDYIEVARQLENDSEIYEKISSTVSKLQDEGYDEDEAKLAAWDQRKFLLKSLMADNLEIIKEEMFEDKEETESNEDDQMEEDNVGDYQ